jgi:hypothetical protein
VVNSGTVNPGAVKSSNPNDFLGKLRKVPTSPPKPLTE